MINKFFSKTYLAQRIKVIKSLFLEKLDNLTTKAEQQSGLSSLILQEINNTQHNTNKLLEQGVKALVSFSVLDQRYDSLRQDYDLLLQNNILFLKSSVDLIQGIQQFNQDSQQQQQAIYKTFQQFQQETREHFQLNQQVQSEIYKDIHNHKFKVITNQLDFDGIEIELMCYLYSWLPFPCALDIGANQGDVTERLLQTGYEVYAFEPFLPVVEKLKNRLSSFSNLHIFPLALGAINEERELHLVGEQNLVNDPNSQPLYPNTDYTLLSSINIHSLPEGMVFTEKVPIVVTTLETLHQQQQVPPDIGLVKIDTEGFDLQVIQGMGDCRYPVVVAEFWDAKFPFGEFGADNRLPSLVEAMKLRGYHWFIVIYRVFPNNEVSFYCNHLISVDSSWGNIFFFQEHSIFSEALKWCSSVMPATYFSNAY